MKNILIAAAVTLATSAPLCALDPLPAHTSQGSAPGGALTNAHDTVPSADCHAGPKIDPAQTQQDLLRLQNARERQGPQTSTEQGVMGVFRNETPLK